MLKMACGQKRKGTKNNAANQRVKFIILRVFIIFNILGKSIMIDYRSQFVKDAAAFQELNEQIITKQNHKVKIYNMKKKSHLPRIQLPVKL